MISYENLRVSEIAKSQEPKVKLNTINKGVMNSLRVKDLRKITRTKSKIKHYK